MMNLVQSTVIFDPEAHTYHTPEGVRLQGITGMIRRQLFPDEYRDVPQDVLDRAAERGKAVHTLCQLVDDLGITPDNPEAAAYIALKERLGLAYITSEYIVSDNTHFASPIDKVYADGDSFVLADIKTTYRLNEWYVRWQLSVYAYLFELQNPGAVISLLLALWIRDGRAMDYEMERIPSEVIQDLLQAEVEGRQFVNPYATPATATSLPDKYRQMEQSIIEIDRQARYWAEQKKALMDGIMREMVLAGAYQWEGDSIKLTRKKDSIRKAFDAKKLAEDHPDIYAEYLKESPQAGSITLKIK